MRPQELGRPLGFFSTGGGIPMRGGLTIGEVHDAHLQSGRRKAGDGPPQADLGVIRMGGYDEHVQRRALAAASRYTASLSRAGQRPTPFSKS